MFRCQMTFIFISFVQCYFFLSNVIGTRHIHKKREQRLICIKLHFYCTVGWQMKNIYIVAHDDWIWLKIYFTGIRCDGKCEHKKCEFIEKFTSEHADHRLFARVWSSFTRRLTLISWLKFVSCSFVSLYVPNSLMLFMLFRCAHQRDDEAPRNFSSLAKLRLLFLALRRAYSNIHVTLVSHSTADWKRSWYVFQQENSLKAVERKRKTWNVNFFFFFRCCFHKSRFTSDGKRGEKSFQFNMCG